MQGDAPGQGEEGTEAAEATPVEGEFSAQGVLGMQRASGETHFPNPAGDHFPYLDGGQSRAEEFERHLSPRDSATPPRDVESPNKTCVVLSGRKRIPGQNGGHAIANKEN